MPNAILNVGSTGGQINISTAAAPATPAVGVVTLYAGTDKALHVKNSDGTDITIAAASAASPITVEQTNSLVSTAIGATATSGSFNSVVIGATATAAGPNQIAIGPNINKTNPNPGQNKIAIGFGLDQSAAFTSCKTIEIGCHTAGATPLDSTGVIIGFDNNPSYGAGSITVGNTNSRHSTGSLTFGNNNCGWDNTIIFGSCNRMFSGLSGNVIYGCNNVPNNVGGTIFGKDNTLLGANSLFVGICNFDNGGGGGQRQSFIGQLNVNCLAATNESTVVGHGNRTCNLSFPSCAQTILGENNCKIGDGTSYCHSLIVGSCNTHTGNVGNCTTSVGHFNRVFPGATGTIVLGSSSVGGTGACDSVVIGNSSRSTVACSVVIGNTACSTAACGIAIGTTSCSTHACSVALGAGITTERANTTHVQSLVAYGQAASKTNAVGSTGGSVTLNWDNSNIQTLTLTSNITTLTKSNPIDGAVYTLFLTQGASGGYTVAWGADVEWAGGTGPTLSTAAGAVDAVSLVYIAGVTGYYGNANLNFS